jgi:glycosyltransferase involved in cell wall biosynthesis
MAWPVGGVSVKIALVGQAFLTNGSVPRQQVEVARYLTRAGHQVHVYSDPRLRDSSLVPGVVFHDVMSAPFSAGRYGGARRIYSYARAADRLLARERSQFDVVYARGLVTTLCDIVHFPGAYLGERARWRAARERVSFARRVKDGLEPVVWPAGRVRLRLEQRLLKTVSAAHADSRLVRDDLLRYYDTGALPIDVVPPGVNLSEFTAASDRLATRRELGLPTESPLVLFCGHDFERKGLDRMLLAMARLVERATLAVVGGGDVDEYRQMAQRLGIAERVVFVGGRSDAARYYAAADVLALPTRVDMWGAPIIEAMASGVPPVTTSVAGAAEAVTDGETGFVLPEPFDVDRLAKVLDSLIANPEKRRRIGEAARSAVTKLSWDNIGRQIETAMASVAAVRRGSARPDAPPQRRPARGLSR